MAISESVDIKPKQGKSEEMRASSRSKPERPKMRREKKESKERDVRSLSIDFKKERGEERW